MAKLGQQNVTSKLICQFSLPSISLISGFEFIRAKKTDDLVDCG